MKVLAFFALFFHVLLVQIYSAQYKKKEEINIFSFIKDRIYSKIEEYQENYKHFLFLVSTLKHHFYDNYYQEPQPKYKLVKRETKQKRTLQNNSTNSSIYVPTMCNDVGKYINTTETQYYCANKTVSPVEYSKLMKMNLNCYKNETPIGICICPKDYTGQMCENKIKTVCKLEKLTVNGQDLFENYDTFYDEYLKNSFSTDFDKETLLNYNASLRCITPNAYNETYYYNNSMTTVNLKETVKPNFTYFMDTNNITISKKPKLSLIYRLYDMKSLLPKVEARLFFEPSEYKKILNNELYFTFILSYEKFKNVSVDFDPMSLLVGGRIFYEIDMIDSIWETIRFIHFHSALDVTKDFEIATISNKNLIIIIVILIVLALLASGLIFFIYFRKKKLVLNGTSEIEVHEFKYIKN